MAARVVIAGGGIAAVEGLLALRRFAGELVELKLIAPDPDLTYRPSAVLEPFALGEVRRYPLGDIARELDVSLTRARVEFVDVSASEVLTNGDERVAYEYLLVAVGARQESEVAGATTFGGTEDAPRVAAVLAEMRAGAVRRVVFVVPPSVAWSLPLYELAVMTAIEAENRDLQDVELALVTTEALPLQLFGRRAGEQIQELLDRRGITFVGSTRAERLNDGRLELSPTGTLEAERVVALPRHLGPALPGLPSDPDGFLPVDRHCAVLGADRVYAAGDVVAFPVKQGGIATQQADAACEAIAVAAGADLKPSPFRPMLRGKLVAHDAPRYLRALLGDRSKQASKASVHALWHPSDKVAGRFLSAYLQRRDVRRHSPSGEELRGIDIETELRDLDADG